MNTIAKLPALNKELISLIQPVEKEESRIVLFCMLGKGKPKAGVPESGSMNLEFFSNNSENYPFRLTRVTISYYDEDGLEHVKVINITSHPISVCSLIASFSGMAALLYNNIDELVIDENSIPKVIIEDFVNRLNKANLNPKFGSRYRAAVQLAMWGSKV